MCIYGTECDAHVRRWNGIRIQAVCVGNIFASKYRQALFRLFLLLFYIQSTNAAILYYYLFIIVVPCYFSSDMLNAGS